MRYRDIALLTGIQFSYDLTTLPAIAEDSMIDAINKKDDRVLIRKPPDPFDNPLYSGR